MKLVAIMPPVNNYSTEHRESIWCGKPIQLQDFDLEAHDMLDRLRNKVKEKVKA